MNPLFDQLRPASFRGIPFQVEASGFDTGRRNIVHEYPLRDKPYAQDLGRKTREVEFDAFVIGNDYIAQADVLIAAMEEYGSGTLIHPWFGSLRVSVLSCRVSFDRSLNYAKFSLSFIESGDLTFPSSSQSTSDLSRIAAGGLENSAVNFFGKVVQIAGKINAYVTRALNLYGKVLSFISNPVFALSNLLGFGSLPFNIASLSSLFGFPINLGWGFAGLLNFAHFTKIGSYAPVSPQNLASATAIQGVIGNDKLIVPIVRGLTRMAADPALSNAPVSVGVQSVSAIGIYQNDCAILGLARQVLLANAVGLSSYLTCSVYDDVVAVRTELTTALDAEALLSTDDTLYQALMTARQAVFTDLTERSRYSARLIGITLPDVLPAVAIAYDRYEDANRDLEIVARNDIVNPGFVFDNPLLVLSS